MSNKAFSPITINQKAVYCLGGSVEILSGVELSPDEVDFLVNTTIAAEAFMPVFVVSSGGYKQRLPFDEMEILLSEPLAARRAEIAAERVRIAAEAEKAWQAAETTRKQQEADQAAKEAAKAPKPEPALG